MFSPYYLLFICILLSAIAIRQTLETVKGWGEAAEAVTSSVFQNLVQP